MIEISEAERDQIYARAFGRKLPPDPAKRSLTLAEAEEIWRDDIYARAFRHAPPSAVLLETANQVLAGAETAAVSESQAARLEAARVRAESAAATQDRTAVEATAFSHALLVSVQKQVVTEGKSFDDVISMIDRICETLRRTSRTPVRAPARTPARSTAEAWRTPTRRSVTGN